MDASALQIPHRLVNEAVTPDGIVAGKGCRDYGDFVMAPLACPGMAGMAMGFVLDLETKGVESGEALAQEGDGCRAHQAGSTFLNGLTVTFS